MFYKRYQKIHNDKQLYMELKNIEQGKTKWVEVCYEHIQELTHGLQTPTTYNFLTIVFWVELQS